MNKKKILILGGSSYSSDIVKVAKQLGLYVVAASNTPDGSAMKLADDQFVVDMLDYNAIIDYIKTNNISGVMAGPSEFHTLNMINICKMANLPCYATPELWNITTDKKIFKNYCRKHGVPTAIEYSINMFDDAAAQNDIEYPVIVKPVDGCSSKGITVCHNREDVLKAYQFALNNSSSKQVVIEQYIDNGGIVFGFRYIIDDGVFYPYLIFDSYIVDPINKKSLISAFTYYPSQLIDTFYREINENVQKMFIDMGLRNGLVFVQAISKNGHIYCHEMGYRLSGGMVYKMTEPLMGINDMKMLIRYAIGEKIITEEEIAKINNPRKDLIISQFQIPLNCGTIYSIDGIDDICSMENVADFLQHYQVGDSVNPNVIGTLGQHLGIFTLLAKNKEEMISVVNTIQQKLKILDTERKDMYTMKFDTQRIK